MKNKKTVSDRDVSRVLEKDGVGAIELEKFQNLPTVNISKIKEQIQRPSWAARIAYNELFGGVLICQQPGEGNRMHCHPDADECWVIIEGEWEWTIEGVGKRTVKEHDIVVVRKGTFHQIKCIGSRPGIRFAITRPDVNHVYLES